MSLEEQVKAQAEEIKRLTDTLKKVTEPPEIPTIEVDGNNRNLVMDPTLIDSGKVRVTMKDPNAETRKKELAANEIRRSDYKRINANIEAISRGELIIVD